MEESLRMSKGICDSRPTREKLDTLLREAHSINIHIDGLVLHRDTFDTLLVELKLTEDDLNHLPLDITRAVIPYNSPVSCILLYRGLR